MKHTPFYYQTSEYDCGSVSVINAINFMIKREQITPLLLKKVWEYTLDKPDIYGKIGKRGTSSCGMKQIAEFINIAEDCPCKAEYIEKEQVTKEVFEETLQRQGCVVFRCYSDVEHYVLLTHMDNTYFYLFDPWYLKEEQVLRNTECINNQPDYNRKIPKTRLNEPITELFTFPELAKRDAILFTK